MDEAGFMVVGTSQGMFMKNKIPTYLSGCLIWTNKEKNITVEFTKLKTWLYFLLPFMVFVFAIRYPHKVAEMLVKKYLEK